MSLPGFGQLHERADSVPSPIGLAVAGDAHRSVLERSAWRSTGGWVEPTLLGPETQIRRLAEESEISLDGFRIVDLEDDDDQANAAVAEVRRGRARLLAKGMIATPSLMRAVLDPGMASDRAGRSARSS